MMVQPTSEIYNDPKKYDEFIEDKLLFNFKRKKNGCWIWTGLKNPAGRGVIKYYGQSRLAYRLSWMILGKKSIDPSKIIHHDCNDPSCINWADCLRQITQKENILCGDSPSAMNARKTHCLNGHKLNEHRNVRGERQCPKCASNRRKQGYWHKKAVLQRKENRGKNHE